MEITSATHLAEEPSMVDDQFSTRVHLAHVPFDLEAFKDGVVSVHALSRCRNRILRVRIPYQNIRIGTGSQHALLRVHAEDFRGVFGGNLHKALERDVS